MASSKKVLYISEDRDPTSSLSSLFQCKDCHNEEPFPSTRSEFPLAQTVSFYPYILEKALSPYPL